MAEKQLQAENLRLVESMIDWGEDSKSELIQGLQKEYSKFQQASNRKDEDPDRFQKAAKRWSKIKYECSRSVGFYIVDTRCGPKLVRRSQTSHDVENARQLARQHIKAALKDISAKNESLGRHLSERIDTGQVLKYNPDPDEEPWEVIL